MREFKSSWDFQVSEVFSLHLQALLRYEDRNSMRHGVEARLPYMDYRLVEHALSLLVGEKLKHPWQKWDLRKASHGLIPDAIAWRKDKMGFVAPDHHVVSALDKTAQHKIVQSQLIQSIVAGKLKDHASLPEVFRWRLHCLANWEEIFL